MTFEPLVEHTRGPLAEIVHAGAIAVVDHHGKLLGQVGNADAICFTRSTLKPFQALPFMQGGGAAHFGFEPEHIALLCASHNGEDMHVLKVDEMLTRIGHSHASLQCGCHVPLRFSYGGLTPPANLQFDERHNNCSGKHAGFLGYCVQHGLALKDHLLPAHPLQQSIRQAVASVTRLDETQLVEGVDGCSAPNYAMPLSRLAFSFARLASGKQDTEYGEEFESLGNAKATQASGAARYVPQREFTVASLDHAVRSLRDDPATRSAMHAAALQRARPGAAADIARSVIQSLAVRTVGIG